MTGLLVCSPQDEPVDTCLEFWRLHVIGEPTEGCILPGSVHGILGGMPYPAKLFEVEFSQPETAQTLGDCGVTRIIPISDKTVGVEW